MVNIRNLFLADLEEHNSTVVLSDETINCSAGARRELPLFASLTTHDRVDMRTVLPYRIANSRDVWYSSGTRIRTKQTCSKITYSNLQNPDIQPCPRGEDACLSSLLMRGKECRGAYERSRVFLLSRGLVKLPRLCNSLETTSLSQSFPATSNALAPSLQTARTLSFCAAHLLQSGNSCRT